MRSRFCKVCGDWHDMDAPWPGNCLPERIMTRSDLALPQIARTTLDYVWNPVNGKHYTCAHAFERDVKASGNQIIGNDSSLTNPKPKPIEAPPGRAEDLQRAWAELS